MCAVEQNQLTEARNIPERHTHGPGIVPAAGASAGQAPLTGGTHQRMTMNKLNLHATHAVALAISLAFSAGAMAQGMSKTELKTAEDAITTGFKSASATCATLKANAKDICMAEAKGKEKVSRAELNAQQSVAVAKSDSTYAIAKEKCDDKSGDDKKACMSDAKAAHTGVMAAAVTTKTIAPAGMKTTSAANPANEVAAAPAKKETTGEYVDDAMITTKVKAAVLEAPSLKSREINVETYKGTVQLTGFVNSRADIDKAVEVAKGIKGVKSVKNDMVLRPATK